MRSPDGRSRAAMTWPANLSLPNQQGFKSRKRSKHDRTSSESLTRSQQFVKVNQYLNLKHIGGGSYGLVYKCLETETKKEYALKEFDTNRAIPPSLE